MDVKQVYEDSYTSKFNDLLKLSPSELRLYLKGEYLPHGEKTQLHETDEKIIVSKCQLKAFYKNNYLFTKSIKCDYISYNKINHKLNICGDSIFHGSFDLVEKLLDYLNIIWVYDTIYNCRNFIRNKTILTKIINGKIDNIYQLYEEYLKVSLGVRNINGNEYERFISDYQDNGIVYDSILIEAISKYAKSPSVFFEKCRDNDNYKEFYVELIRHAWITKTKIDFNWSPKRLCREFNNICFNIAKNNNCDFIEKYKRNSYDYSPRLNFEILDFIENLYNTSEIEIIKNEDEIDLVSKIFTQEFDYKSNNVFFINVKSNGFSSLFEIKIQMSSGIISLYPQPLIPRGLIKDNLYKIVEDWISSPYMSNFLLMWQNKSKKQSTPSFAKKIQQPQLANYDFDDPFSENLTF